MALRRSARAPKPVKRFDEDADDNPVSAVEAEAERGLLKRKAAATNKKPAAKRRRPLRRTRRPLPRPPTTVMVAKPRRSTNSSCRQCLARAAVGIDCCDRRALARPSDSTTTLTRATRYPALCSFDRSHPIEHPQIRLGHGGQGRFDPQLAASRLHR